MKTLSASLVLVSCLAAYAVDFTPVNSPNISSPGSIKPMAKEIDRNFAAAKVAIDAAQSLDADLTDLADGSLTGSKVGSGIPAGNVTTGNLPLAVITNAAGSLGASIGGDIPVAAVTNALDGAVLTTNVFTGDGVTNTIIWATVGPVKVLKSITTTP